MRRRSSLALLAVIAAGTVFAPGASGQIQQSSYFMQHNFRIFPGGNMLPVVQERWYDHAFVRELNKAAFQVTPVPQLFPGIRSRRTGCLRRTSS